MGCDKHATPRGPLGGLFLPGGASLNDMESHHRALHRGVTSSGIFYSDLMAAVLQLDKNRGSEVRKECNGKIMSRRWLRPG